MTARNKILYLLIALTARAYTQDPASDLSRQSLSTIELNNATTFDNRYEGVRGTPYVQEEWFRGTIQLTEGNALDIPFLNYNRFTGDLCMKKEAGGSVSLLNRYKVRSFDIIRNHDTLQYERMNLPGEQDFRFLQLVYNDRDALYMDDEKIFVKADYQQAYSADRRYDEFRDQIVYYIKLEGSDQLLQVKKNRKYTASLFGACSNTLLKYMKSEKTDLSSAGDLVKLLTYYRKACE